MKRSYQEPDPATTLRVIENEAPIIDAEKKSEQRIA